jgi:UDP-N-acetylglucosamine/UDP-N-acetylgalactosamine 4-epimerase
VGKEMVSPTYIMEIFNVAFGINTTLFELFSALKGNFAKFDKELDKIEPIIGPKRQGDIPHGQATINKLKIDLSYYRKYDVPKGSKQPYEWY